MSAEGVAAIIPPPNNMKNNPRQFEIYRIIDSFLVEAKDQHGKERSLERLNQDRHLAAAGFEELFSQQRQEVMEEIILTKEFIADQVILDIEEMVREAMEKIGKLLSNPKGCGTDTGAWLYPISDVEDIFRQALQAQRKKAFEEGFEKGRKAMIEKIIKEPKSNPI